MSESVGTKAGRARLGRDQEGTRIVPDQFAERRIVCVSVRSSSAQSINVSLQPGRSPQFRQSCCTYHYRTLAVETHVGKIVDVAPPFHQIGFFTPSVHAVLQNLPNAHLTKVFFHDVAPRYALFDVIVRVGPTISSARDALVAAVPFRVVALEGGAVIDVVPWREIGDVVSSAPSPGSHA